MTMLLLFLLLPRTRHIEALGGLLNDSRVVAYQEEMAGPGENLIPCRRCLRTMTHIVILVLEDSATTSTTSVSVSMQGL